jgi:hypothetical protein
MTKGVLIYAFNNSQIDYAKLAIFAAERVKHFLNVPISIITNDLMSVHKIDKNQTIDQIIEIPDIENYFKRRFYDGEDNFETAFWKNSNRYTCYELSPYDETLVIDADYIINSNHLSYCWECDHDFLIYKKSYDLSETENINYVSEYSIPFYWATVFYFKKTQRTKCFFDIVNYIRNNWTYYSSLYNLPDKKFRNDFAFSIAIHMLNGFFESNFIKQFPGKLYYISDRNFLMDIVSDQVKFLLKKDSQYIPGKIQGLDLHFMNKFNLLRFLENV